MSLQEGIDGRLRARLQIVDTPVGSVKVDVLWRMALLDVIKEPAHPILDHEAQQFYEDGLFVAVLQPLTAGLVDKFGIAGAGDRDTSDELALVEFVSAGS